MGNLKTFIILVLTILILAAAGFLVFNILNDQKPAEVVTNKTTSGKKVENKVSTKTKEPVIKLTADTEEPNVAKVIVHVLANVENDKDSIKSIILPTGDVLNTNEYDYEITANGEYTFSTETVNGEKTSQTINIVNIAEISAYNPYIPEGFSYVGGEVDTGYVIQDAHGNQFVWVPIPNGYLTRNVSLNGEYSDTSTSAMNLENSVAKYYGFYIGRFECCQYNVGDGTVCAGSLGGQIPWTNVDFLTASQACSATATALNYPEDVETDLINSFAWDTALAWMDENVEGANKYSEAITFGNYGVGDNKTILPTGDFKSDIVNNICDMAGNVREWTEETYNEQNGKKKTGKDKSQIVYRVVRGGCARLNLKPSTRTGYNQETSDEYWGFRMILFKK